MPVERARGSRVSLKDAWLEVFPELEDWVADRRAEHIGPVKLRRLLYTEFGITISQPVATMWLAANGAAPPRKPKPPPEPLPPRPPHTKRTKSTAPPVVWRRDGKAKAKRAPFDSKNPDDPRHGTLHGYLKLKCDCARCKAEWAAYQREYSHRRPTAAVQRDEAIEIAEVLAAVVRKIAPESTALKIWEKKSW